MEAFQCATANNGKYVSETQQNQKSSGVALEDRSLGTNRCIRRGSGRKTSESGHENDPPT